jgi:Secretion system C-terminal sorting domain/SprB repeat
MKKQLLTTLVLATATLAFAQTSCFDFGNGSNGAYSATTNTTLAGGTYNYTTFNINSGVTVSVTGNQPLIIRCTGAVTINGTLTAAGGNGGNGVTFSTYGLGGVGVAGGGNGGNGVYLGSAAPGVAGSGPGGVGTAGGGWSGGGGAGYSAVGASSGNSGGGYGGPIYGNADISGFESGSGGGGGSGGNSCGSGGGGAGGGLIFINSAVSITIGATGVINVNGGNGGSDGGGNCGGGGGGSGGSIIMQSASMTHNGILQASGGAGGASMVPGSPYYGVGGAGAPGRIRLDYNGTLNGSGSVTPAVGAHYAVSVLTTMAVSTQDVSCNGGSNGSALATVMNGNSPYTYAWSPSGGNSTLATGLAAGTYTFTVTDALGCTATTTVSVTEPPALTAVVTGTDILCNGGNSGQTTVVASGGVPSYTYSWSPSGGNTATQTNLTAGCYSVTVTDMNNCTTTQSICITEPSALSTTTTVVNPSCYGGCDGTGTITVTGGVAPYQYSWCSGETSANAVALCDMPCTINITDANGCTAVDFATVSAPPPAQVNVLGPDTMICDPATIQLCASGGVSYFWSNNVAGQCVTADTTICLSVIITDSLGCQSIDTICVTDNICLGISDASATEFSIAPNPAADFVIITHGQINAQLTQVYDAQGRIVKSAMLNNKAELNLSDLAPGIYSVRVNGKSAKLIIE